MYISFASQSSNFPEFICFTFLYKVRIDKTLLLQMGHSWDLHPQKEEREVLHCTNNHKVEPVPGCATWRSLKPKDCNSMPNTD